MKNDVKEGIPIPIKNYEFVLPPDFKIEEAQMFVTKIQPKKSENPKIAGQKSREKTGKSEKTANSEQEEEEEDLFPEEERPKTVILKKAESLKTNLKARPYSAYKKPVEENRGKTVQEQAVENTQKQGAKEFVTNWLEQADTKRQTEVQQVENNTKFRRYDNKISEEISELIKKLEHTRKSTTSSIKNMRKTLTSAITLEPPSKPSFTTNPFSTFIPPSSKPTKPQEKPPPRLDLHALYSTEFPSTHKSTQMVVSDDEDFVKDIEFDD